ncbi:MAG: T9SS type A sorting domain-containing protein [Paludibacter sp.]|nr:T9SS type A sorting domain-containing protein [Paludibacter sp.]
MKKITFLMALALIISAANAQEMNQGNKTLKQFNAEPSAISKTNYTSRGVQDEQLIMNWVPDTEDWTNVALYTISGGIWGWVCGMNGYGDAEKAERFDLNVTGQIVGVYVLAHTSSMFGRSVTLKIYNDAYGYPGTALYTQQVPLSSIPSEETHVIDLNTPFSVTSGSTYYVSFAFNYTAPSDSIALYNQLISYASVNTAYELYNGDWYTMEEDWGTGAEPWNLFVGLVVETSDNITNINSTNNINISQNDGQVSVTVSENSTVRVLDMTGKLMGTYYATPNATLTLNQQSGLYLFEVQSRSGIYTEKVLIR